MRRRVVVTGLGAVTSISCQVEDLWKKILAGQSGVHELTVFDTQGGVTNPPTAPAHPPQPPNPKINFSYWIFGPKLV